MTYPPNLVPLPSQDASPSIQIIRRKQLAVVMRSWSWRDMGDGVVVIVWLFSEAVRVLDGGEATLVCRHAGTVKVGMARMPEAQTVHVLDSC